MWQVLQSMQLARSALQQLPHEVELLLGEELLLLDRALQDHVLRCALLLLLLPGSVSVLALEIEYRGTSREGR